jgi:lipid II:glycine glycyltransferase (peptidoglycan interpeptide bridge formation enzyme)
LDGTGEILVITKMDDLKVIQNPDKETWSEFVYNHPHSNIYQTPEMAEVYRGTKNYEPISLAVVDDTDKILAVMLAVVIKEIDGFLGSFSARSIIQGGPLCVENDEGIKALTIMLEEYGKLIKKRALYSEIRNMHDTSQFKYQFRELGYNFEDHLNFLIDLNKPTDEIWGKISRSMRKNIKRAQKKGVRVEELEDRELISTFYEFLEDVYHQAKVPLVDVSFFYSVYDILVKKNMAKFHLAKYNRKYIGGRLSLMYNKTIYADYVGVPNRHKNLHANPLLNWHVLKWGLENGYHIFDFGGAGKPNKNYGVREFKRQFGGKLVNFGRYSKIHSPIKMEIAKKGFEIYKKVSL